MQRVNPSARAIRTYKLIGNTPFRHIRSRCTTDAGARRAVIAWTRTCRNRRTDPRTDERAGGGYKVGAA